MSTVEKLETLWTLRQRHAEAREKATATNQQYADAKAEFDTLSHLGNDPHSTARRAIARRKLEEVAEAVIAAESEELSLRRQAAALERDKEEEGWWKADAKLQGENINLQEAFLAFVRSLWRWRLAAAKESLDAMILLEAVSQAVDPEQLKALENLSSTRLPGDFDPNTGKVGTFVKRHRTLWEGGFDPSKPIEWSGKFLRLLLAPRPSLALSGTCDAIKTALQKDAAAFERERGGHE